MHKKHNDGNVICMKLAIVSIIFLKYFFHDVNFNNFLTIFYTDIHKLETT